MAHSKNGRYLGKAAVFDKAEKREALLENLARDHEREVAAETANVCQQVADIVGTRAYRRWWKASPDVGFYKYAKATVARLLQNNASYKGRHVPGHVCPTCKITMIVNEKEFKTTDPDHPYYTRRLVCPNWSTNGCRHKEPWSDAIESELIEAAVKLAAAPPDF